jgi:hypothetical protein
MRKRLIVFFLGLALTVLLGYIAWTLFEIYPRKIYTAPAPEARANEYLALDRWLEAAGRPVRVSGEGEPGDILRGKEKTVFIQASCFDWEDDPAGTLLPWVEEGGSLVVMADYRWNLEEEEAFTGFLESLGVKAGWSGGERKFYFDSRNLDWDHEVYFEIPGEDMTGDTGEDTLGDMSFLRDGAGIIRLVRKEAGRGKIVLTGTAPFLHWEGLRRKDNALLAWGLLAEDPFPEGPPGADEARDGAGGVLFIRGETRARGFFGKLLERGNGIPLGISLLVILALGLRMAVPVFGRLREELPQPVKPLRERFLAEAWFLKNHGALGAYRDAYLREIRRKIRGRAGEAEALEEFLSAQGEKPPPRGKIAGLLYHFFCRPGTVPYRHFGRIITQLKTMAERL